MAQYRKKPVVIEAIQWTGDNYEEISSFIINIGHGFRTQESPQVLFINTLEGQMIGSVGDYIIKGVNGEYYPCKPDIFEKTYEAVK